MCLFVSFCSGWFCFVRFWLEIFLFVFLRVAYYRQPLLWLCFGCLVYFVLALVLFAFRPWLFCSDLFCFSWFYLVLLTFLRAASYRQPPLWLWYVCYSHFCFSFGFVLALTLVVFVWFVLFGFIMFCSVLVGNLFLCVLTGGVLSSASAMALFVYLFYVVFKLLFCFV